VRRPPTQPE